MEIVKFKTNIKTENELEKIKSLLDKETHIQFWKLDLQTPDAILAISGKEPDPQEIINTVQKAGFQAEILQVFGTTGQGL